MAFSTAAEYPSGCYRNRLARATVSNVDKLKTYVDSLFPSGKDTCIGGALFIIIIIIIVLGSTNYKESLASAFDLFIQSPSRSDENVARKNNSEVL